MVFGYVAKGNDPTTLMKYNLLGRSQTSQQRVSKAHIDKEINNMGPIKAGLKKWKKNSIIILSGRDVSPKVDQ